MKVEELVVKVVDVRGSFYELGLKQAQEIKETQLLYQQSFLEQLSRHSNAVTAKELLKTISPNLLEELTGLADGLNMELETIIRFYSGYDVNFPAMGCTAFINDNYYVRNYDFSPDLYDERLGFS